MRVLKDIGKIILISILFLIIVILTGIDWAVTGWYKLFPPKKVKGGYQPSKSTLDYSNPPGFKEPSEPCEEENPCKGCTVYPADKNWADDAYLPYDEEEYYKVLDDAIQRAEYLMRVDRPLWKDEKRIIILAQAYTRVRDNILY